MGIYDRDYVFRDKRGRGGLRSVNAWLIGVNIAVFLLEFMTLPRGAASVMDSAVGRLGALSTYKVTYTGGLEFWRFLTFQFLHANLTHILFNMVGLYMFGRMVEEYLGPKRYLAFYLSCGAAGGLMYFLLNALGNIFHVMGWPMVPGLLFHDTKVPLVGASAGVFGVIMACAYISPNTVVQLIFPPIPMRLRTMAYAYVAIAVASLLWGSKNAGGEAAHLGGAVAGFVLIRNAHLLRDFFDVFTDSRKTHPSRRERPGPTPPPVRRESQVSDEEIDRILVKVRTEGLHSLTEKEQTTLRRATEAKRSSETA